STFERFGLLFIPDGARTHDGHNSGGGELRRKLFDSIFGEAVKNERSLDRLQHAGEVLAGTWQGRCDTRSRGLAGDIGHCGLGWGLFRGRLVERIDLEHVRNWRNPSDRFLGEFPDTEGKRTREFAIEIDGAAAHTGYDASVFHFLAM